ncbi:MAG TPA: hypothetical protein PLJ04_03290 [Candidatus Saccharibacteria bacterium]|nr:hypothetical protein [Candidatus Saccharibacteria bacterium]
MYKNASNIEYKKTGSPRPIMRIATGLNFSYGIVEATVGLMSGSSAAFANGWHNFLDSISHGAHTSTHKKELSDEYVHKKVMRRRRLAATAIAAGAIMTGANAARSIANPEEAPLNVKALSAELGAVAINAGLIYSIKRRRDDTLAYKDAERHFFVDGSMATVTSFAIAVTPYFHYADGIGGMIATSASGWLAYKTYLDDGEHAHVSEPSDV